MLPSRASRESASDKIAVEGYDRLERIGRGGLGDVYRARHASTGAPVFSFESGEPRVVSVVSAMAEVGGEKVSLGTQLEDPLTLLRGELDAGRGVFQAPAPEMVSNGERRQTGAKFAKP